MNKVSFFIRQSNDNLNRLGNLCIHDTFKMARNDFLSEANFISPLLCIRNVTQCNLKNSHHLTGIIAVGYDGMPLYMIIDYVLSVNYSSTVLKSSFWTPRMATCRYSLSSPSQKSGLSCCEKQMTPGHSFYSWIRFVISPSNVDALW